ncbi:MAG: hypothetical protein WAN36_13975 [Calditrichia bacterium]
MKLLDISTKVPKKRLLQSVFLIAILLLMSATSLFAQSRTHNVGDFLLRIESDNYINTNEVDPTGAWPQDYFRYDNIVFQHIGLTVGTWVDSSGVTHSKESFFYPVSYNQEAPYGIQEYRRDEPPTVYVFSNGQTLLSSRPFNGKVVPDLVADQMIELHYKSTPGFDVVQQSYAFANQNHNDYVIHRIRYLTTFDWDNDPDPDTDTGQTLQDVYFFMGYSFQTAEGTWITYARWYEEGKDDWATYETYTPTLSSSRPLQISYGWDGDHPDITEFEAGGPEFDDTGDPRFAIGSGGATPMPSAEFVSSAYAGFAALHVDTSPTDHSDDINQPTSIIANMSIYNVWDADFPGFATIWDWAASGTKQTVDEQSGWPDDPGSQEDEYPFQAFGPYNLSLGDSVVIVWVVGANGISRDVAVEKGLEWREWYRGGSSDFDDAAKNDLLATGKDSLFQTMDRAMWAWDRNLNIPDPLPAPDLTVTSGPNKITLEWEDLSGVGDADTGVPDLDHYRIYRKKGSFLVDTYNELNPQGTHLKWEFIADVPADQTTYVDNDVVRGEPYHYAVTAVDDGSQNTDGLFPGQALESSIYLNRSEVAAYAFEPGAESASQVRVVPNPYIARADDFNFSGDNENDLLFVNLPPYCTIRIFTATGDLIKTIDHQTGSADERWDQVTNYNQRIASGVYILQVDDAKDINGKSISGTIEKFVVVR